MSLLSRAPWAQFISTSSATASRSITSQTYWSRDAPLTSHGVLQARRLGSHLAARAASASAPVTHIFTSNLQRAHRTAAAVRDAVAAPHLSPPPSSSSPRTGGGAIEVVQLPELREKHFGTGEGQRFGARAGSGADRRPRHEGAEGRGAMRARAERFVEGYLAPLFACVEAAEPADVAESVVIVAHGIILGVLASVLRAVGNFAAPGPVPEDDARFSWSNTGYVEMRISTTPAPSASNPEAPAVKWPGLTLRTVAVNCTDHLRGLKKTRGGIGSAEFDERQKTLSSFFTPTSKKRKHEG